jgi:hypothetical protein
MADSGKPVPFFTRRRFFDGRVKTWEKIQCTKEVKNHPQWSLLVAILAMIFDL